MLNSGCIFILYLYLPRCRESGDPTTPEISGKPVHQLGAAQYSMVNNVQLLNTIQGHVQGLDYVQGM